MTNLSNFMNLKKVSNLKQNYIYTMSVPTARSKRSCKRNAGQIVGTKIISGRKRNIRQGPRCGTYVVVHRRRRYVKHDTGLELQHSPVF